MKKRSVIIFLLLVVILLGFSIVLYKRGVFEINKKDKFNEIDEELPQVKASEEEEKSKELFQKYYSNAEEKMQNMSIEKKVGQMFLARCPSDDSAIDQIRNYNPGGYVLFERDFENKKKNEVVNTIKSYQEASDIPMLMAVDEEGGTVVRVSNNRNLYSYTFESPQQVYKNGGYDAIKSDANKKAKLLLSLGINVNLAPVSDVSTSEKDYMYNRSFGKDANSTAEFVKDIVEISNNNKLGTTLKHFPGYGSNSDTHTGISIDKKTKEQYENVDLVPFKEAIKVGAPSILVSHNIVECYDSKYPSSLSKPVHELLRDELGFTGIIMTDDLSMKGITNYTDGANAAVLAVNAGNDILISSDLEKDKDAVIEAIKSGTIKEETINNAVKRIIAWKYTLGLM